MSPFIQSDERFLNELTGALVEWRRRLLSTDLLDTTRNSNSNSNSNNNSCKEQEEETDGDTTPHERHNAQQPKHDISKEREKEQELLDDLICMREFLSEGVYDADLKDDIARRRSTSYGLETLPPLHFICHELSVYCGTSTSKPEETAFAKELLALVDQLMLRYLALGCEDALVELQWGVDGANALHFACAAGQSLPLVKHLTEVCPEEDDEVYYERDSSCSGCMPIHYACRGRIAEEENVLNCDHKASAPRRSDAVAIVQYLQSKAAGEGFGHDGCGEDYDYQMPLHFAAQFNHLELVKYWIEECKIDVNLWNEYQYYKFASRYQPIHRACEKGNLKVVQYLVEEAGCELHNCDHFGYSPLGLSCKNGHDDVVQFLVVHHSHRLSHPKDMKFCRNVFRYLIENKWDWLRRELSSQKHRSGTGPFSVLDLKIKWY